MADHNPVPRSATTQTSFDTGSFFLGPSILDSSIKRDDRESQHGCKTIDQRDAQSSTCSLSTKSTLLSGLDTRTSVTSGHMTVNTKTSDPTVTTYEASLDDRYLALGTIKLVNQSESVWSMRGRYQDEPYPHHLIDLAQSRRWIRLNNLSDDKPAGKPRLQVYIMPEDVDRGNRGPLKEFRKVVQLLLSVVDRSVAAWLGTYEGADIMEPFEVSQTHDEESLFYIFNTLRSPSPNLDAIRTSSDGFRAVSDVIENSIIGLSTPLYSYQTRSVAAMIQRETDPAKVIDPRKTLFNDIHGTPFYVDIVDGTLVKTPPLYPEPQGGILAETMGYGKTLICVALILATRGHYPRIPEDRIDTIPVNPRPKVASLLSMAAKKIKHEGIPWKSDFYWLKRQGYHYDLCLEELGKYDRAYDEPTFNPTTPNRRCKPESANLIYLCSATLVIVPPNLLLQWQHEIRKHVEDDALDVLIIDSLMKEIPSSQRLLEYDMILITKSRFEQEYQDDDLHQGKRKRGTAKYRSPLTQIRWLRVICDEGHGFAGSSSHTKAMAMLDNMYIERRWVVSGTPSSTLHGVEVDLSTASPTTSDGLSMSASARREKPERRDSINTTLQRRKAPGSHQQEAKDLERLRIMVVKFLHLQPWANQRGKDNANWKKYLAPVIDASGNRLTSPVLREVLQTLIIRHRIEDIDTDLTLPPLYNNIVYLKPSYHDKLAINMFSLVLTSNYVTSEREDEDYMFHPRNRKKFDLLVNNLRQATFHWVGFSEHDIKETLRVSRDYLAKNVDKITDHDLLLLYDAIMNAERALDDPSWISFSKLHEIGCFVTLFPESARGAWALDGGANDPLLLGTVQAREAQKFYHTQLLAGTYDPLSNFIGKGLKVMNTARANALENEMEDSKIKLINGEKQQLGTLEEPKLRVTSPSTSPTADTSHSKRSSRLRKRSRSLPYMISDVTGLTAPSGSNPNPPPIDLPPTAVSGFTSSKLAYLMSQLLHHSKTSKSIIFYSSNNTAFWTAEALELLHIPFLIYANTLSVAQRNSYLSLFNADDSIRVLLMDLKQASHGLHIASANRVYIIAPIWDQSVESQAIKRAHRIGQTRAVHVETLVLEGTFEEEMVKRRKDIDQHGRHDSIAQDMANTLTIACSASEEDQVRGRDPEPLSPTKSPVSARQKIRSLLDDQHMVQVLKNISFLQFSKDEDEHVEARVARLHAPMKQRLLFNTFSHDTNPNDIDDPIMTDPARTDGERGSTTGLVIRRDMVNETPRKKARTVGFAEI